MNDELISYEIGVTDTARVRTFYGSLFGWRFEDGPSGNGVEITTPNVRGGMHGGGAIRLLRGRGHKGDARSRTRSRWRCRWGGLGGRQGEHRQVRTLHSYRATCHCTVPRRGMRVAT